MLKRIVLCSVLIAGGFWLGYSRASASIDKEVRKEILKEKEVQALRSEIESLKYGEEVLMDAITQSAMDESQVRTRVGTTLLDIAKDLDSYTHSELRGKLVLLALELSSLKSSKDL